MADEKKHDPINDAYFIFGVLAILIVVWFAAGGPEKADLRGLFLAPPPPLGSGEGYGPQIGEPAPWAPTTTNSY